MSGVGKENIKSLIKLRKKLAKARFLILGKEEVSYIIIRNLFNRNFNEYDLKCEDLEVRNLNIEKDISITYCKAASDKIDYSNYDYIFYGISLLSKRLDFDELEKIKKVKEINNNIVLLLTNIEKLDLREFTEMKESINNIVKDIDILSVMDSNENIESRYNQWYDLVEKVEGTLVEKSKGSFMKSQIIDNRFKNYLCDDIINFYINIFEDIQDEVLKEEEIIYIQSSMINEVLDLYPHNDEITEAVNILINNNIKKLIDIKKEKIITRLKKEEEERLKKEAKEKREREEKERLKKEEEEKIIKEKKEEEEELARVKQEKEKRRLEEEKKIRVEEEVKRKERLKQERLDLIELKKLEEERKILNEKIKELNKKLRKKSVSDSQSSMNDMIIEASFTVDDIAKIEPKNTINEIEARIDEIIYEAIATRIEELAEGIREEIKEKLRDSSII